MKKKFKVEELDCANCAAKMEAKIKELAGVNDASMNFMTQKFMLDADDECFDTVLAEAQRIISKIEPDCRIIM